MVFVQPELNKTLRILLDGWLTIVLQVATAHDSSFGCIGADSCCTDAEA